MTKSDDPYQDLTRIRGIGEARQKIFRDELDIKTYHDLANLDKEAALSVFRRHSEAVSGEMLETWMETAAELALETSLEETPSGGYSLKVPDANNGWQAFATFVVDYQVKPSATGDLFQTTVHFMQKDETRSWPDIDTCSYYQWINEQLGESEYSSSVKCPSAPHAYSATIRDIQLGDQDLRGAILRKRLSPIKITLNISNQPVPVTQLGSIRCRIRCLLQNLESEEYREISQEQPLLSSQNGEYETFLDGVSIAPGNYRMWITVVLNSPLSVPHFTELGKLTVVDNGNSY